VSALPAGWADARLPDVADVLDSMRVPVNRTERAKRPGPVPYYGATGQVGWIDNALFNEELCLIGEDGAPFLDKRKPKAYLIHGPAWVNNHAHVLRARAEITSHAFLKYLLDWTDYSRFVNGTTRLKLTKAALAQIPVALPPLAEQRRIVAAVEEQSSRVDAAETALETALRRLVRHREAVLDEAFRSPTPARKVGELASLSDGPFGSNLKTSHYVEDGPRVVRLQNIGDGFFRDERAHITTEHFNRLVKHAVVPGDIVAASLGETAPRACLVPTWLGPAIVKADCIRIRPNASVDASYLMWSLNSRPVRTQAAVRIKGIGRPRLGLGGIRELVVPLPPLAEQVQIVAEVEQQLSVIDAMRAAIESAQKRSAALRRSILERAFTGKLVPQDPDDEPASVLLERIRAEREAAGPSRRRTVRSGQ
jgi:type I restriction enzyme S subunit